MEGNILLVDDEREITELLEVYLKNEGFCVYKFYRADPVISCINEHRIDLAVLDVMLPDEDGFSLCRRIREHWFFPIIMLTAKISDEDKIEGLTMGTYDNDMTSFHGRDDVLTMLIHLGYDIDTKEVFVPNNEILDEFKTSTKSEEWTDTFKSFKKSQEL